MRNFLLAFIFCFSFFTSLPAQTVKGLYVDGFNSILGNTLREDSLLNYAQLNGFNYLAFYQLHLVHAQYDMTNFNSIAPLAAFINRAKTQYGIQKVGAIAENYWFFENRIRPYNSAHSNTNEKFDVYNLEFEFWITSSTGPSGYYCTTYLQPASLPCDTAGAFFFFKNELRKIDSLAALDNLISETYVGWPNAGQCRQIAGLCDRVLLHSYVATDATVYGYTQTRLSDFAGAPSGPVDIIVIFSSEQSFMGPWLTSNPETQAFSTYTTDFQNDPSSWTSGINLIGYQWFAYTDMIYSLPLSTTDIANNNQPSLFQNGDQLEISFSDTNEIPTAISIYNSAGQLINQTSAFVNSGNKIILNTAPMCGGIYFAVLQFQGSNSVSEKFIISH